MLNSALFAKQLDFSRMVLVGHSKEAAGATQTGRLISGFGHQFTSLSYALIAPEQGAAPPICAICSCWAADGIQRSLRIHNGHLTLAASPRCS